MATPPAPLPLGLATLPAEVLSTIASKLEITRDVLSLTNSSRGIRAATTQVRLARLLKRVRVDSIKGGGTFLCPMELLELILRNPHLAPHVESVRLDYSSDVVQPPEERSPLLQQVFMSPNVSGRRAATQCPSWWRLVNLSNPLAGVLLLALICPQLQELHVSYTIAGAESGSHYSPLHNLYRRLLELQNHNANLPAQPTQTVGALPNITYRAAAVVGDPELQRSLMLQLPPLRRIFIGTPVWVEPMLLPVRLDQIEPLLLLPTLEYAGLGFIDASLRGGPRFLTTHNHDVQARTLDCFDCHLSVEDCVRLIRRAPRLEHYHIYRYVTDPHDTWAMRVRTRLQPYLTRHHITMDATELPAPTDPRFHDENATHLPTQQIDFRRRTT